MNPAIIALLFAGGICLGMFFCLEVGLRVGTRRLANDPDGARHGIGAMEGAVFGLLGLLIAFTFSGAASRFDDRRQLIREEANDIGTAWLRLDLLAPEARAHLQELFRQYLDSRIATYKKLPDLAAAYAELAHSLELQSEIWTAAVVAARETGTTPAPQLLLPALNDMIDIVTTRTEATKLHPPPLIFGVLGTLALVASLMAGYGLAGGKGRSWVHIIGFVVTMGATIYVIMDMEYPRFGLIRVDAADQVMIELRASWK
jgi:hypothetical protein